MRVLAATLSLLVFLAPWAQPAAAAPLPAGQAAACSGPPCGYITPLLELEFAGKPRCGGAPSAIDLSKCIPLPPKGQSASFDGTFSYSWKLSEDLTYPPGQEPVVVSFSGVSTNPKWLSFQIEPASLTIDPADLVLPTNMRVDQSNPAAPVVYYDFRAPVKVTFTHSGDPDQDALDRIAAKRGVTDVLLKAKSTGSGAYFKEGFGIESFRFATASLLPSSTTSHGAPAGVLAPLLGVALAAAARRRPL